MTRFIYVTVETTCLNDGKTSFYLAAICDNKHQAMCLLKEAYDDAKDEFITKRLGSIISNPRWEDDVRKNVLIVDETCTIAGIELKYTKKYSIIIDYKENIFDRTWLFE